MALKVEIEYPTKEVGKSPFRFSVYVSKTRGNKIIKDKYGTLEIRKGTIRWITFGGKEKIDWKWTKLNKEMKKSIKKLK